MPVSEAVLVIARRVAMDTRIVRAQVGSAAFQVLQARSSVDFSYTLLIKSALK